MRNINIEIDQMSTHYVLDPTGSKKIEVTDAEYRWLVTAFIEYTKVQKFLEEKYDA